MRLRGACGAPYTNSEARFATIAPQMLDLAPWRPVSMLPPVRRDLSLVTGEDVDAERARQAVTARIRDTIRRLRSVHPELAEHLAASVTTGTFCSYRPDPLVSWSV